MKIYILFLLIFFSLLHANCVKDKPINNINNIPGLPPATQMGANTFGFLLNGVPWTPKGNRGTANLSFDFDPGMKNGIFGIAAYRVLLPGNVEDIGLGITDSLNFKTAPFTLPLYTKSMHSLIFEKNTCSYFWIDTLVNSSGSITITKLDRIRNIIAGTFNATLFKAGCDTIRITEGRFDIKF